MSESHIVLIYGGSLEFSLALARQAAKKHWTLARVCNDAEQEQPWLSTLSDLSCERSFIHSHLKNETQFRQAAERVQRRWGKIDTIINLADKPCLGLFETSSEDDWDWTFQNNLMTVVRGCKVATSILKRQGHGRVVNITTQAARIPQPGLALTSSLQGAVVNLSESLQAELSPLGIEVRLICVDLFDGLLSEPPRTHTPIDAARFERQLNTDIGIDKVAAAVFKGMEGDEFLTLTHKSGQNLWRRYRKHYGKWLALGRDLAAKLRPDTHFLRRK